MVQVPKVNYFVKQTILKQNLVPNKVKEMSHKLCKGHVKDNVWYVHTSMLNMCQISSLMAAAEGPVAEFSSLANSKKRKGNRTF